MPSESPDKLTIYVFSFQSKNIPEGSSSLDAFFHKHKEATSLIDDKFNPLVVFDIGEDNEHYRITTEDKMIAEEIRVKYGFEYSAINYNINPDGIRELIQ